MDTRCGHASRALGLTTLLVSCAACGTRPRAQRVERTDSAGVEQVTSGGRDIPLHWRLTRRFVVGGAATGPASFYRVGPLNVGADALGHFYVLFGHHVAKFDADGRFVARFGREGEGPGELRVPGSLGVSRDGTVSVFDIARGALVRWDSTGRVLPERPAPDVYAASPDVRHMVDTGFSLLVAGQAPDAGHAAAEVLRWSAGRDTADLGTVPIGSPALAMFPSCGGGLRLPKIFVPEIRWDAGPGEVVAATTAAYAIDVFRAPSPAAVPRLWRVIRRDIRPRPATRALAVASLGKGMRVDFGRGPCLIPPQEMADKRGWAKMVPVIGALTLDPDGSLWVRRTTLGPQGGEIDVFAAGGAYEGTLPRTAPFPLIFLSARRFLAKQTDPATGIERLAAYDIQRR